ncbi:MAG: hypothetical protein KA933_03945 [Flavobacterium sp.]|nr:hypothetical protein [Flavobacterium sp.]
MILSNDTIKNRFFPYLTECAYKKVSHQLHQLSQMHIEIETECLEFHQS